MASIMANTISISTKLSRDKTKVWYYLEWGKSAGQRRATGLYTWANPKGVQKEFNKEVMNVLERRRSELTIEMQAVASGYVPRHKIRDNFFDYYQEYVTANERPGNRSLSASLTMLRKFWGKARIVPMDITENFCERFRNYLLDNLSGETPGDYFMRFKRVMRAATKEGYFRIDPSQDVKVKVHPSLQKDILEANEWKMLMNTPCSNHEVKRAAIFSLYTGLRWCDIEHLTWNDIKGDKVVLMQRKTGHKVEVPMHEVAKEIVRGGGQGRVFLLPTQDGANKILKGWVRSGGIDKHITWHSLRHSMSVLLQDAGVAVATVAGLLGHTSSKYVHKTYQRYRRNEGEEAVKKLPS